MNKKLFIFYIVTLLSINFTFAQNDVYQNVGGNLDGSTSTTISNTSTGGLADTARYAALMVSAAIITLVIFKLIEGAVLKGTYDNIYDQQKGNKILKNATISFFIFIFVNLLFTYINPDYGSWIFNTSTGVTPTTNTSSKDIAGQCTNDPKYISASFLDQLKQDEEGGKFADKPYVDSLGYPTIGWGFNIDSSNDPKKYLTQVGIKDTQLTNLTSCKRGAEGSKTLIGNCGNEKITKEQADKLLVIVIEAHLPAAKAFAGGEAAFNKLPVNIQNVIKNISYAGDGTLAKFTNLKAAVRASPLNYDKIAAEVIDSDWCKQTKSRCGRVVGLVYNGQCPTITSVYSYSIYGSNKERCDAIKSVKQSDLVDLRTYGLSCTSSNSCLIKKDVAEDLQKLDTAYHAKFKTHISIASAYRSDVQQADTCRAEQGTLCAKPCSQGGSGSNHSFGDAIDFSNETIGGCSKTGACSNEKNEKFKWLNDINGGGKFNLFNKLSNDNPHFSRSGK